MVLRFLFRRLASNEELVQRLSESYPVRRAAQLSLYFFYRGKSIAERNELLNPERFRAFFHNLKAIMKEEAAKTNLKQQIEAAKKEIKRK